jgi:hypothetical protein
LFASLALGAALLCPTGAAAALLNETQIYETAVTDISCPTTHLCAVTAGVHGEPHPGQEVTFDPLAARSPVPTPLEAGVDLFAIACPSSGQCTVGNERGQELTFNPPSPGSPKPVNLETGLTHSVACPSEALCVATGYPGVPAAAFDPAKPEAATHFTLGSDGQDLYELACPAVTECVGVSRKGNAVTFDPRAPGAPVPFALDPNVELHRPSCPSVSRCNALAAGEEITFNPRAPSRPVPVAVGGGQTLRSVSCPSAEPCRRARVKVVRSRSTRRRRALRHRSTSTWATRWKAVRAAGCSPVPRPANALPSMKGAAL